MEDAIKEFYRTRSETNWTKRYESPYLLRRYYSRTMWKVIAEQVESASLVLDAGCGDGVLAVLMARWHPCQMVIAMDISQEAVKRAKEAAVAHGVADRMYFVVGDAEKLPFKNGVLPAVVSSHVLEHLPDFDLGAKEIGRVLREDGVGVLGIPSCLNPSAMVLLGGDNYWTLSKKTVVAFWIGFLKVLWAWLTGREGVNEGYAGHKELPHVRRFPWKAVRRVSENGLVVEKWMADSLLIPYLARLLPGFIRIQSWMDARLRAKTLWRNFGVGLVMIVRKRSHSHE